MCIIFVENKLYTTIVLYVDLSKKITLTHLHHSSEYATNVIHMKYSIDSQPVLSRNDSPCVFVYY